MNNKILVLGVGDITLRDEKNEGKTIRQMLDAVQWPDDVDVFQCDLDHCHLHPEWKSYDHLVIVVTVVDPNHEPGTVYVTRARLSDGSEIEHFSPSLVLRNLVDGLLQREHAPEVFLVTISMRESDYESLRLSPTIVSLLPQVQMLLRGLVGMLTRRQDYLYY